MQIDWNKIIENSKKLMKQQTEINQSPLWLLTEMAVKKGEKLTDKYKVDQKLNFFTFPKCIEEAK